MTEIKQQRAITSHEYEQASNSYLMTVVSVIAGLPLPIINLIAAVGFYLGQRKSTYFVRWHCIQCIVSQAVLIPFNSIAFAWTLGLLINSANKRGAIIGADLAESISPAYICYMLLVLLFNLFELFAVVYTASRVRKGNNVRWPLFAPIADKLTSTQNRDIYTR